MRTGMLALLSGAVALLAPAACRAQGYTITTVAGGVDIYTPNRGDGGPANKAFIFEPMDVALDAAGNLYIADRGNVRVRKVSPSGVISTVAGGGQGDDGGLAINASMAPSGIALDPAGNLYIADIATLRPYRIRKVDTNGKISTIAAGPPCCLLGEGGPAISAGLGNLQNVALDKAGNLYFAEQLENRVRKVDTNGTITTVAGSKTGDAGYSGDGGAATSALLWSPYRVAVDSAGALYIADEFNSVIRKVTPAGIVGTVAGNGNPSYSGDGGPAIKASLRYPRGIAVDSAGNLYIADSGNHRIRMVKTDGTIATIAGTGDDSIFGDGGPATSAGFDVPWGITVDSRGVVYVAD